MIYLNKITQIGEISILTIPNMYGDFDSSNIINCGGAKQEEYYNVIDCGHADSDFVAVISGGLANLAFGNNINVELVHTISRKSFATISMVQNVNDTNFKTEIQFNEIPQCGQYSIKIINGGHIIYNDLLQIGDFENNNETYNKEIKIKIYER